MGEVRALLVVPAGRKPAGGIECLFLLALRMWRRRKRRTKPLRETLVGQIEAVYGLRAIVVDQSVLVLSSAARKILAVKAGRSCAQLRPLADNWVEHLCAPTDLERTVAVRASGSRVEGLSAGRYMHHITAPWKQKFILQAAVGRSRRVAVESFRS